VRTNMAYFPEDVEYGLNVVWGVKGSSGNPDYKYKCPKLIEFMKDLDISLTRIGISWRDIESEKGKYQWEEMDKLIDFLHNNGIRILAVIACAPDWAIEGTESDLEAFNERGIGNLYSVVWPKEKYMNHFLEFMKKALERYKGKVKYFEFWNEPDGMGGPVPLRGSDGKIIDIRYEGNARRYTYWLKELYKIIKEIIPDAKVAAGALTNPHTNFIKAIYSSGGKGYFDAISLHPYGNESVNIEWIKKCREVMLSYGDYKTEIWVTEFGWCTFGKMDEFMGKYIAELERQGERIRDALEKFNQYPYITQVYHHTLNDWPWADENPKAEEVIPMGLVDNELNKKPSYEIYKTSVAKIRKQREENKEFIVPEIFFAGSPAIIEYKGKEEIISLEVPDGWEIKTVNNNKFEIIPKLQKYTGETFPIILRTDKKEYKKYVEAVSPIQIAQSVEQNNHLEPGVKAQISLTTCNISPNNVQGKIKVILPKDWSASEAEKEIILSPQEYKNISFDILPSEGLKPDRYNLRAKVEMNGIEVKEINFTKGINLMCKMINGKVFTTALLLKTPLHRIEHPKIESYINFWYDENYLYFGCIIKKNKLIQRKVGYEMWLEDSVQLCFDALSNAVEGGGYDLDDYEYLFALTSEGPIVWRYAAPEEVSYVGKVDKNISLDVEQTEGKIIYKAVISWEELKPFDITKMKLLPFSVLINYFDEEKGVRETIHFGGGLKDGKFPYENVALQFEERSSGKK